MTTLNNLAQHIEAAPAPAITAETAHAWLVQDQQCPDCGQMLEQGTTTTTGETIMECCNCGEAFVRDLHTLELKPVYGF